MGIGKRVEKNTRKAGVALVQFDNSLSLHSL